LQENIIFYDFLCKYRIDQYSIYQLYFVLFLAVDPQVCGYCEMGIVLNVQDEEGTCSIHQCHMM
jgi:hypothetical protein